MSSNLKVNNILPSTGTTVAVSGIASVTSSVSIASSCTATTFYGSGANLTSLPAQATIANNADNRVITGGSGVNLNGEANLTFDGSALGVTGDLTLTNSNHVTQVLKAGGATSDLNIDFKDSSDNLEARIFCASDQGDLRFYTGGANERIRITSDGRIGMHISTPNNYELDIMKRSTATDANLRLYNNGTSSSNDTILRLHIAGTTASNYIYFGDGDDNNVGQIRYQHSNNSMQFYANAEERLRITNAGQLLINQTSGQSDELLGLFTDSTGPEMIIMRNNAASSTKDMMTFMHVNNSGSVIFRFKQTGGLSNVGSVTTSSNSTSYNTSSDYRLKENAVLISDGISRLKTLKPYRFNFKTDPTKTVDGFFAHEVTAVPEAIHGTKDAVETTYYTNGDTLPDGKVVGDVKEENAVLPQSLDYAKLTPLLTAALQEAIAKIEILEAKVAALEGS